MVTKLFFRVLAVVFFCNPLHLNAGITFGSRNSAIEIANGATFNISASGINVDGTFIKHSGSSIEGGNISFQTGKLEDDRNDLFVNATYNPTSAPGDIYLAGSPSNPNLLRAQPGTIIQQTTIQGTYNKIEGQPLFTDPISFDANATLSLAIQSKLNKDIQINGGTLYLEDDLKLGDAVTISGNGRINLNSKSLSFGGKAITLTNDLVWEAATDITLNSRTTLSGRWNFVNESNLNGNGNVLDLTSGGTLFIESGATLYLTDVAVKGVGIANGSIIFEDDTAKIQTSNASIELLSNYTTTLGGFYIDSETTLNLKDYNWTFNTNASMTVDGCTLWTDALNTSTDAAGSVLFGTPNANFFSSVNSGTIKETGGDTSSLETMIVNNSNAIVIHETEITNNSNAIVITSDLAVDNSYAIIDGGIASDLAEANSNWIVSTGEDTVTLAAQNSNASVSLDNRVNTAETNIINNSNAIIAANDLSVNNSGAIIQLTADTTILDDRIDYNWSWILDNRESITTNAENISNNSEAIIAFNDLAVDNSYAIIDGGIASELAEANSNWIVSTGESTSTLATQNSNSITIHETEISNNSEAIIALETNIANNSEAVVETWDLAYENSQAIVANSLDLIYQNSLAINANRAALTANSEAIISNSAGIINNSNAIINNSNAIAEMQDEIELVTQNSNAIAAHETRIDTAEIDILNNSNAIVPTHDLAVDNSNAIDEMQDDIALIAQNSAAITSINPRISTVEGDIASIDHGPGNLAFDSNSTLSYDLFISENHNMTANESITINGAGHSINLGETGSIFTVAADKTLTLENIKLTNFDPERISLGANASVVFGDATSLEITSSIALDKTYSFAGTTAIRANDNEIYLNSTGGMTIQSNGLLTIENARIQDLSGTNLNCQNDASKIVFNNSDLHLAQDYTFTKGALEFKGDMNVTGTKIFNYETDQVTTIAAKTHLNFDIGTTFHYAPSTANKQLISMTDATSILSLNGSTLKTTTTGMQLTKGRLIVNHINTIESDAIVVSEGLTFGDGTSANDLNIDILPGGRLKVNSGFINYLNTD